MVEKQGNTASSTRSTETRSDIVWTRKLEIASTRFTLPHGAIKDSTRHQGPYCLGSWTQMYSGCRWTAGMMGEGPANLSVILLGAAGTAGLAVCIRTLSQLTFIFAGV